VSEVTLAVPSEDFNSVEKDPTAWRRKPVRLSVGSGVRWYNLPALTLDDHLAPPRRNGFFRSGELHVFRDFEVKRDKHGWGIAPPLFGEYGTNARGVDAPWRRLAACVAEVGLVFRDYDQGISLHALLAALDATPWGYVLFPTYSHLGTTVKYAESTLNAADYVASMRDKLREKKAEPEIIESLRNPRRVLIEVEHGGVVTHTPFIVCDSAPVPKWRVAFVTAQAWRVQPPELTLADWPKWATSRAFAERNAEFTARSRGLDSVIGVPNDDALHRVNQYTYPPRRHPDRDPGEFFIHVRDGACPDVDSFPCVEKPGKARTTGTRRKRKVTPRAPGARDGEREARDVASEYKWRTKGLRKWARTARRFDFHAFCKAYKVPGYRKTRDGKASIPCPLRTEHSDGGAVDSGGFFLRNATAGVVKSQWFCGCCHVSGPNHKEGAQDRLKFLDALCHELGVTDARSLNRFVDVE